MITVVSNLARAGSCMTMLMLDAGGMPCVGRRPGPGIERHRWYEVPQQDGVQDWLPNCEGMAVKILEPTRFIPPPGPEYRVIWIDRDLREQAKSNVKTARDAFGANTHRSMTADIRRQIRELRQPCLDIWSSVGARMLMMRFEHFLKDHPRGALDCARRIQKFLGVPLDVDAMASVVVKRRPACLPYMLELQ